VKYLKHTPLNQQVYQKSRDLDKTGDPFTDVLMKILYIKENTKENEK
jgi:hypothetical protein